MVSDSRGLGVADVEGTDPVVAFHGARNEGDVIEVWAADGLSSGEFTIGLGRG